MAANGTVLALSLWRGGRRGPTTDRQRTAVAGTVLLPLSREVNSGSRLLSLSRTFSLSGPPLTIPDQEIFVEGELLAIAQPGHPPPAILPVEQEILVRLHNMSEPSAISSQSYQTNFST